MPRRRSPFELLILDCDGVIVDSEPITNRVLSVMLDELGVGIGSEEVARRFVGMAFPRLLDALAALIGGPLPADFVRDYRDRSFAALEAELKPVEGIEGALDAIGVPYCVASNGPHAKMRRTLTITSLLPRFEGRMFSSEDVGRGKPFPDLFLHAASRFAVPPSACLVIEDSASGIAAALGAGMTVYGFSGGETEAEQRLLAAGACRVFHHMRELPGLAAGGD